MGICSNKPKNSEIDYKKNRKSSVNELYGVQSTTAIDVSKLVDYRENLLSASETLTRLGTKVEGQAKKYIKNFKRGRGIFALKRLRLYNNFNQDVHSHLETLEKAILGQGVTATEIPRIQKDIDTLLMSVEEFARLEGPLKDGEQIKDREERFKFLFKRHHIQTSDIFSIFAEIEAEANEITLTTSTTFKKSDIGSAVTQPGSQNLDTQE